jgi:hypothetical protein
VSRYATGGLALNRQIRQPGRWAVSVLVFIGYSFLTIGATRPAFWHLGDALAGDATDAWQTLWGFWWWHQGREYSVGPMFTRLVWWPHGSSVWFQTWDIPSALVGSLLWDHAPHLLLYNCLVLLTFPLSGLTFYWLCQELWRCRPASIAGGALYAFSTFHFANASAVLHIASLEWSPLVVLGIVRLVRRPSAAAALLAGGALGLATLASPYHLLACVVALLTMGVASLFEENVVRLSRGHLINAGIAATSFIAICGWMIYGMLLSYTSHKFVGAHQPELFSADLQSFFLPNAVSVWGGKVPTWRLWKASHWSGATFLWADAAYIGYSAAALAVVGALHARIARLALLVAAVGAVLALGPQLQIGGHVYAGLLPYGLLERLVPSLSFAGIPSRFCSLVSFGVGVAAAGGVTRLWAAGMKGRGLAILATVLALVEAWPSPQVLSHYESPPIFQEWEADSREWAVLDATWWSRALWHQTQHGHPIIGGYLSRAPEDLWSEISTDPVLVLFFRHLVAPSGPTARPTPEEVTRRFQELRIRFVVIDDAHLDDAVGLEMIERFHGAGIRVYETSSNIMPVNNGPCRTSRLDAVASRRDSDGRLRH